MSNQLDNKYIEKRKVIKSLAHHNPKHDDFNNHVIYIFNYAICLGCFSFYSSVIIALILCNIFYDFIVKFISLPIVLIIFILFWMPSIFQYSIQYIRMKPMNNRKIKFATRFLYPIGSILFIFKSPIWGFLISIPAGLMIIFIRKRFYKKKNKNEKIP
ncbi:MAG: hypothetical protein ACFFBP_17005 [Promethearchaeota archaeon]